MAHGVAAPEQADDTGQLVGAFRKRWCSGVASLRWRSTAAHALLLNIPNQAQVVQILKIFSNATAGDADPILRFA